MRPVSCLQIKAGVTFLQQNPGAVIPEGFAMPPGSRIPEGTLAKLRRIQLSWLGDRPDLLRSMLDGHDSLIRWCFEDGQDLIDLEGQYFEIALNAGSCGLEKSGHHKPCPGFNWDWADRFCRRDFELSSTPMDAR